MKKTYILYTCSNKPGLSNVWVWLVVQWDVQYGMCSIVKYNSKWAIYQWLCLLMYLSWIHVFHWRPSQLTTWFCRLVNRIYWKQNLSRSFCSWEAYKIGMNVPCWWPFKASTFGFSPAKEYRTKYVMRPTPSIHFHARKNINFFPL